MISFGFLLLLPGFPLAHSPRPGKPLLPFEPGPGPEAPTMFVPSCDAFHHAMSDDIRLKEPSKGYLIELSNEAFPSRVDSHDLPTRNITKTLLPWGPWPYRAFQGLIRPLRAL